MSTPYIIDAHDVITGQKTYYEYGGVSGDTKPEADRICTGSIFHEVDTKKIFAYNEAAASGSKWVEQMVLSGE